jgi:hypothetical protein
MWLKTGQKPLRSTYFSFIVFDLNPYSGYLKMLNPTPDRRVQKQELRTELLITEESPVPKLDQGFADKVHDETLKTPLSIITGLTQFKPSLRISAS